jgi:undecaprenyl-diphosphatase
MLTFDAQLFRDINNAAGQDPWLDAFGIFAAKYLIWLMAGMIVFVGLRACAKEGLFRPVSNWWERLNFWVRRPPGPLTESGRLSVAATRAYLAAAAAYLGNFLFSLIYFRPRPCGVLLGVHKLINKVCTDKSFPSDHSSLAFAAAFSVIYVRPLLGSVLLVMAALVAWGRVFVGVHYPLDVAAGALVGLFWALVARAVESRSGLGQQVLKLWKSFRLSRR